MNYTSANEFESIGHVTKVQWRIALKMLHCTSFKRVDKLIEAESATLN